MGVTALRRFFVHPVQQQHAQPQPHRRREKRPCAQRRGAVDGRDQQAPHRRRGHDPGGEAQQHPLQAVARQLVQEKDARRAQRRAEKREQYPPQHFRNHHTFLSQYRCTSGAGRLRTVYPTRHARPGCQCPVLLHIHKALAEKRVFSPFFGLRRDGQKRYDIQAALRQKEREREYEKESVYPRAV